MVSTKSFSSEEVKALFERSLKIYRWDYKSAKTFWDLYIAYDEEIDGKDALSLRRRRCLVPTNGIDVFFKEYIKLEENP